MAVSNALGVENKEHDERVVDTHLFSSLSHNFV